MPDDFDTPASVANEQTQAVMPDDERKDIAEGLLALLGTQGVQRSSAKGIVYTLINSALSLGAIHIALADLGLELGALVRATALSGLAVSQAQGDPPPDVIEDLAAIANDEDEGGGGDAGDDADPIAAAAELLEQLDDEGRQALAEALVDRTAGHAGLAELLDHFLPDDGEDDDNEGADRVE